MLLEWMNMQVGMVGLLWRQMPAMFRLRWRQLCTAAGLQADMFTAHCLRRGGATFDFVIHANVDCGLLRGRWMCSWTAHLYIRQGEEMLSRVDQRERTLRTTGFSSNALPALTAHPSQYHRQWGIR